MNPKLRNRIIIASAGIIVVVLALVLFLGGKGSASSVSIADLKSGDYAGQKLQVQGSVVNDSYSSSGKSVSFAIYDPQNASAGQLTVVYEGALSASFGNGVTAICTGVLGDDGVLQASELVTKCPSKYESASDALSIQQLLGYGDSIFGKTVKVAGQIQAGSLAQSAGDKTFVLIESSSSSSMKVQTSAALPDGASEGSSVVLTGSLDASGVFHASELSLGK